MAGGKSRDATGPLPLSEVLAYRHAGAVERFRGLYRLSEAEAQDIFVETLRWLWMCAYSQHREDAPPLTCVGLPQLVVVDEMWHNFVLFTEAYGAFCARYLGTFVHHVPAPAALRRQWSSMRNSDPEGFAAERLAAFRVEARWVGEVLGAETVRKWFSSYAQTYSPAQLDALKIPLAEGFG